MRITARLPSTSSRLLHTTACTRVSRGLKPVPLPNDVTVQVEELPSRQITFTGRGGMLQLPLSPFMHAALFKSEPGSPSEHELRLSVDDDLEKSQRAMLGNSRAHVVNAVKGVTDGWVQRLRLVGVGYRAALENAPEGHQRLRMKLGFSHDIVVDLPEGVQAELPKPTEITVKGIDLYIISQFAAKLQTWRRPEPYNGKGIFINDETIKLKDAKKR